MTNRPLLTRVAAPDTLLSAWQRIHAKRSKGGIDRVTVEEFAADAPAQLETLRRELIEDRYIPQPLLQVSIPKENGTNEKRTLGLPTVRDKIAQEAVRSVIEPRLDRTFLDCSYGYRPRRGPQRAIARVNHYLTSMKRRWITAADIDDFFGTIDHGLLIERLHPVLQDEAVLRLIELWVKMGSVDARSRWHDVYSGVSQGGVISPLLANFYLHPFDQSLVSRNFGLIRYADNFVILSSDRAEAERALVEATDFLNDRLSQRLNPNPRPIVTLDDGFSFLGIFFQTDRRTIDRERMDRIASKIRRFTTPPAADNFARAFRELNEAVVGWRRFYASVLPADGLDPLERLQAKGLSQLVARAFRTGTFKTAADAELALANVEVLTAKDRREREAFISGVVRDGRAEATRRPPQSTGPSANTAVRKRKRRHYRKLAQISELVLSTPGCFLGKKHERVIVRQNRQNICEIPSLRLTSVTVASHGISLSADVISHCAENDIPITFLSPQGKIVAVISAPESSKGAVNLLQLQALSAGKPALELAKRLVGGKIRNQVNLMKYCHKYRKHHDPQFASAFISYIALTDQLLEELERVHYTGDYEHDRGHLFSIEGRAASQYWDLVSLLLKDRASFAGRERRGASDLVNSLLNYGYALLQSRVYLAVVRAGLTAQISYLHSLQKGKPTLVFDLMEEFRPQAVDRTVITMLTLREAAACTDEGLLTEDTRRHLIARVHDRLATIIRFRGQELKLDEIIQHQANLLVAHLKGEKTYRPFIGKW